MSIIKKIKELFYNIYKKEEEVSTEDSPFTKFTSEELKEDNMKYAITLAEKSLEETNKAYDSNTTKSNTILGILTTINVGLLTYFFNKNSFQTNETTQFSPLLFTVFVTFIGLTALSLYLSKNLTTGTWHKSGQTPESFFNEHFYKKFKKHTKYEYFEKMLFNTLNEYNKYIQSNEARNSTIARRINISIYLIISTPIAFLLVFTIVLAIYHLLW